MVIIINRWQSDMWGAPHYIVFYIPVNLKSVNELPGHVVVLGDACVSFVQVM